MDLFAAQKFVDEKWNDEIVPELTEYIRIPAKSPHFDPDWEKNGYIEDATQQIYDWCRKQDIVGMTSEIVRLPGRTPVIFMDIPGTGEDTVLMYGHLDKQPEMVGWASDLDPWKAVLKGDKLYGRGGADDGYAAYASLTALMALHREGVPHARCVVLIEACEESGSFDLPYYIDHLAERGQHTSSRDAAQAVLSSPPYHRRRCRGGRGRRTVEGVRDQPARSIRRRHVRRLPGPAADHGTPRRRQHRSGLVDDRAALGSIDVGP